MYFSHPSPYEMGGSSDIEAEDAALVAHGIKPSTGKEVDLLRLEGADPINRGDIRGIRGFSLTAFPSESIDQRLGIGDVGGRLSAGLEATYYDRVIGTSKMETGPDGGIVITEPTTRPL